MKKFNLFIFGVLIGLGISAHATEYTTEEINQFYNKLLSGLVRDRYLPETVSEKQDLIIERIQNSTFMNELKEKTYPCFSKIQGLTDLKTVKRIEVQNCLSPILYELDQKVWISVAEVESGKEVDENNPIEKEDAMRMGSEIVYRNSRTRDSEILRKAQVVANPLGITQNEYIPTAESDEVVRAKALKTDLYALELLNEIRMQSYLCSSNGNGMEGIVANELKNPTCGVDLICQRDSSILVNFKNECTSEYGHDIQSGVSVEDIIKAVQKEIGKYHTFTCQGHSCVWKKKE